MDRLRRAVPVAMQAAGMVAVLVGLFLLLPVKAAILAGGLIIAVIGVALEVARAERRVRPAPRARGES